MELYNSVVLQKAFCNQHKNSSLKEDIQKFFSLENIIDTLGINTIYTNQKHFNAFLSAADVSKICLLASVRFDLPFKYKQEDHIPKIKIYEYDKEKHSLFNVKNNTEVESILKEHRNNSPLGLESKKKKENSLLAKKEKYNRLSNLDRDFSQKIVSIDFEFNPGHAVKRHINCVTEFGLAVQENGKITNFHYLIDDNIKVKETQFQFEFGDTNMISRKNAIEILSSHIQDAKYLLFHGYSEDYGILKTNKINMRNDIEILDTLFFYRKLSQGENDDKSISLKNLLTILNLKGDNFHNSGNDAAYTLSAFNKMNSLYINKIKNNSEPLFKEKTINANKSELTDIKESPALEQSKNSRLYDLDTIKKAFSNLYPNNKEVNDYFDIKNIFCKIAGLSIYTEKNANSILINRRALLKLCQKASEHFSLTFKYSDENLNPIIDYTHIDDLKHQKHIVKSQDDITKIVQFQSKKAEHKTRKQKNRI